MEKFDIIIAGAGSAGVGAALAAGDYSKDAKILLFDKSPYVGGVSVHGGVNNWEPGVSSALGYHRMIAEKLMKEGNGFVAKTTRFCEENFPFGLSEKCKDDYSSTLKRAGVSPENQRRFVYEWQAMDRVMREMLSERGVTLWSDCSLENVVSENNEIKYLSVRKGNKIFDISAERYIDCCGNLYRKAGCECFAGAESRHVFGEPSAPSVSEKELNGITLCFLLSPSEKTISVRVPEKYRKYESFAEKCINRVSCLYKYPNGTLSVNMLPTYEGSLFFEYGEKEIYDICTACVYYYAESMQKKGFFENYDISYIFPTVGYREEYRLYGKKVLTEKDILGGVKSANRYIAFADHPMDMHKAEVSSLKNNGIYGIDYECLLTKEFDNLAVAGKCGSFSHIGASSCRLSRTMMALGEAAGVSGMMSIENKCSFGNTDIKKLQKY
ncbi:MAG: FAD-dependent oxidoreductase, partial [Armatimonadetes bacterium]|nr:FAD-dependent oxidoreductase [Candidatus Hippobium faecium]